MSMTEIPWRRRVCFINTSPFGDDEILHWALDRSLEGQVHSSRLGNRAQEFLGLAARSELILEPGMYFTWYEDGRLIVDPAGFHEWQESLGIITKTQEEPSVFLIDPGGPPPKVTTTQPIGARGEFITEGFGPGE